MISLELKSQIKNHATDSIGFDDCRFTDPFIEEYIENYRQWLSQDYHGEMDYLQNHLPLKENPNNLLEGVQTAIVLIKNYKNTLNKQLPQKNKIARYAVGQDYHTIMREGLEKLCDFIEKQLPEEKCYWGVDSRPIAERSLAIKAGIGFLGKNTMVIKPGKGSYFFIGVVFTTAKIQPDSPLQWDCGQCRICLDACPTNAFPEPFKLDATKCLSYQTIEQKETMTDNQLSKSKGWLFGCDICQEVCPYNHEKTPMTNWKAFMPEAGVGFDFFDINDPASTKIPRNTPLYRSRKRVIPNWEESISLSNECNFE